MTAATIVILLFIMLCAGHVAGLLIPHRPAPREVEQVSQALAEEAYASLLDLEEDEEGWTPKVQRYSSEEYKRMRAAA